MTNETCRRFAKGGVAGTAAATVLLAATVQAQAGSSVLSGFGAGVLHPFMGLDHLLAMVAVGLWAGMSDIRYRWIWPALFVSSMIAGSALGMSGLKLPSVEPIILASVLVLGLATALRARAPRLVGVALITLFGLAHGYAHGIEMPHNAHGLDFGVGFTLATAALHTFGLVAATALRRRRLGSVTRVAGAGIAAAGIGLILGA